MVQDLLAWSGLVPSIVFFVVTSLIAHFLRRTVKNQISNPFVANLFNEAIATGELCADCWELIIVADNYGVSAYAVFLFLLTILWSTQWEDATACPYIHLENWVNDEVSFRDVFLKIWAQVMGGCSIYYYVQYWWWFHMSKLYEGRAFDPSCTADLQVNAILGAVIEAAGTCICRIASNYLAQNLDPRHASPIDAFISTSMVVAGFTYTGGYYNPALATALKFGCEGNTLTEHMFVYWVGSIVGALSSVYICRAYLTVPAKDKSE